jgi:hypothetical protein
MILLSIFRDVDKARMSIPDKFTRNSAMQHSLFHLAVYIQIIRKRFPLLGLVVLIGSNWQRT